MRIGKIWSRWDLLNLRFFINRGRNIGEIADFLCRTEEEVLLKIQEQKMPAGAE